MPFRPHLVPHSRQRHSNQRRTLHVDLSRTASALLIIATATSLSGLQTSAANERDFPRVVTLPTLANTAESDREMVREVPDDHLFAAPITSSAEPASRVDATPETPATAVLLEQLTAEEPDDAVSTSPSSASDATGNSSGQAAATAPIASPVDNTSAVAVSNTADLQLTSPKDDALGDAPATPTSVPPSEATSSVAQVTSSRPLERIRTSLELPVRDHPDILAYRQRHVDEALWIGKIFERSRPFIGHVVEQLAERSLPLELALLPVIESGYRPEVLSKGLAVGLWQIVPITAEEIGMELTPWFDPRADTIASTTAAIDYLSFLNAEFNADWELVLAAYNAGPTRVRAAIRKNKAAGLATDFWSLTLPAETRDYVPKFLSLVALIREPDTPLPLPVIDDDDGFERVEVGQRISIGTASTLTGVDLATLKSLNTGLVHGVTAPEGPHMLYVPRQLAASARQRLTTADIPSWVPSPDTHVVVAGDTLSQLAERYDMSQRQLMVINRLEDSRIRVGQTLNVRNLQSGRFNEVEYVVTTGDTLSTIADRHSVTSTDIRDANGEALKTDVIHPGEVLKILVDLGTQG